MATPEQLDVFCRKALHMGALDAVVISPKQVFTAVWVRLRCQFGCSQYGQCLTCPPYSPTPETTRKMLDEYTTAILVHGNKWKAVRKIAQELELQAFLAGHYKAFAYLCGPCDMCKKCVCLASRCKKGRAAACRHPDKARPAMEAAGMDVFATARAAGLPIEVVSSTDSAQDYYSLVLVD
jgi:predicted metal-binding protein